MSNPQPPDTPADPAVLVDYQAGSIVSRTLIKDAAGSVTLFAFDAGEALSEHTVPFDALLHVIDGRVSVRIADAGHTVECGQMIRLPAGVPHAVRAEERFKMFLVMIRSG